MTARKASPLCTCYRNDYIAVPHSHLLYRKWLVVRDRRRTSGHAHWQTQSCQDINKEMSGVGKKLLINSQSELNTQVCQVWLTTTERSVSPIWHECSTENELFFFFFAQQQIWLRVKLLSYEDSDWWWSMIYVFGWDGGSLNVPVHCLVVFLVTFLCFSLNGKKLLDCVS